MENTKKIIRKIAELYSNGTEKKSSEEVAELKYEQLMERASEWKAAFDKYDVDDVINAINTFWRYKSDKSRPSVSQILSMLQSDKVSQKTSANCNICRAINIEQELFNRDRKAGRAIHILPTYKRAVDIVMNDFNNIHANECAMIEEKDNSVKRYKQYKLAVEYGFFDNFSQTLDYVAKAR